MKKIIFCLAVCTYLTLHSQEQRLIDSLRTAVNKPTQDTNLVKSLNLLSRLIKRNDSKEAMELAQKAQALSFKLDYKAGACQYL